MILRARVVLPVLQPAIPDGAVLVSGKRIAAVGRWREIAVLRHERVFDLGYVILMPGLVNAHCHLDYTGMAGHLPPPKIFTDWLKQITETKAGWSFSDYAQSWLSGAQMLVRTGTTTVGDIEAVPELLPEVWNATPLRVLSFLEMIGITGRRPPRAILQQTLDKMRELRHPRCLRGLSPHAPYSTVPELLRLSAATARRRRWRLCTHVAESALEFEMFTRATGLMHDWMRRSGREMSDCGLGSPVDHLERCGLLGENLLATHVNYLGRHDAVLLARRNTHVAHCPRSHHYFRHDPFPLRRLRRAGVNVCLGTDSLASVYKVRRQGVELSLFDEMRALANGEPWLAPRTILHMATLNGARALGLSGHVGQLSQGAFADLIALSWSGRIGRLAETVLHHTGPVTASMIDGHWAVAPTELQPEIPELWRPQP